jgi:hypothetical protein
MPDIDSWFINARPARRRPGEPLICTILVDAEEDFDWNRPVNGTPYDVDCMRHLADLQSIVGAYGAVPTYLLTYPVMRDAGIVSALRARVARGQCQVGIQLHPWVTPPFTEPTAIRNSFMTNLSFVQEEAKLQALIEMFRACFGTGPLVFRAGRYGLGQSTPALLEKHGLLIDTSLAPCTSSTDEQGPDFSAHDYQTFWFGASRRLLELPLCRSIVGWGGYPAALLYRKIAAGSSTGSLARILPGLLARARCAERITLSPEGNDAPAAARLVRSLAARGQGVLALSLHSSSFSVGRNPYVRNNADLHKCFDRLSAILDRLSGDFNTRFVASTELPDLLTND